MIGGGANEGFFNPHLLVRSADRVELQKRFFARLLAMTEVYYINAEMGKERLKEAVGEIVAT
jgi:hypothetical protein